MTTVTKKKKIVIFAPTNNIEYSGVKSKLEKCKSDLLIAKEIFVCDDGNGPEIVRDVLNEFNIPCNVVKTDWKGKPKSAAIERDSALYRRCNYVIVITDGNSKNLEDHYDDAMSAVNKRARKFKVNSLKGDYVFDTKVSRSETEFLQSKL